MFDEAHPRMSLNMATIRRAGLREAIDAATGVRISSLGLWWEPVRDIGVRRSAEMLREAGMRFSGVCRAGYFVADTAAGARAALDEARRSIVDTAELAAHGEPGSSKVLVIVAGGMPPGSRDVIGARQSTRDAIASLAHEAAAAGITLAIEPLHPMFAADRGVVSTLSQALDIAEECGPDVGVVVDTYHVWWDPEVLAQIARAGRSGRIAAYQVSDWVTPLPEGVLLGRGLPGEGVIDFDSLTSAVLEAGYRGDIEVEIFNQRIWDLDFPDAAQAAVTAFWQNVRVPWAAERPVAREGRGGPRGPSRSVSS